MEENITGYLNGLMKRYPVLEGQKENIFHAYEMMAETFACHGKLLVAGNGGSAADAEHIVGELMKGFVKQRKLSSQELLKLEQADAQNGRYIGELLQGALPAIAVVDHVALSTAYLNDVDPMLGFAQQVYGYGHHDGLNVRQLQKHFICMYCSKGKGHEGDWPNGARWRAVKRYGGYNDNCRRAGDIPDSGAAFADLPCVVPDA